MTPIEHLQSVCTESAGWVVQLAEPSASTVRRRGWTIDLISRHAGYHCAVYCGAMTANRTDPDPIHAITTACAAVVEELRELTKGAP